MDDPRLDEFRAPATSRRVRPSHPKGWEPGIDTAAGTLTTQTDTATEPDWAHVLEALNLDPDDWQVVGNVQIRSWDVPNHGRMYYHRADVRPASDTTMRDAEFRRLCTQVSKMPRRRPAKRGDGGALVVGLADWQIGKGAGDGVEGTVGRIQQIRPQLEERFRELVKCGRRPSGIVLACLGDLIESCDGHYAQQTFETELDLRQQVAVARRLLLGIVDTASKLAPTTVVAVPGNHGENRRDGKSYTTWGDNWDVAVPEMVAEICTHSDRYQDVQFHLPAPDKLTLTVEVAGTVIGLAHGHQFRRGGSSVQQKALHWWGEKIRARSPIGDADLLLSGHYHSYMCHQEGTEDGTARTWIQCPTVDPGSPWWEHTGGQPTARGTLTVLVQDGLWSDLQILRP